MYISVDRVLWLLLWKNFITKFGHIVSEIWIFQVNVMKLIQILKFDGNLRFYRFLLEFNKTSNQKYKIE